MKAKLYAAPMAGTLATSAFADGNQTYPGSVMVSMVNAKQASAASASDLVPERGDDSA